MSVTRLMHRLPLALLSGLLVAALALPAGALGLVAKTGTITYRYITTTSFLSPVFWPAPSSTINFAFTVSSATVAYNYGLKCSNGAVYQQLGTVGSNLVRSGSTVAPNSDQYCWIFLTLSGTGQVTVAAVGGTYDYFRPDPISTTKTGAAKVAVTSSISLSGVPSLMTYLAPGSSAPGRIYLGASRGPSSAQTSAIRTAITVGASTAVKPGAAAEVPPFTVKVVTNNPTGYTLNVTTTDMPSMSVPANVIPATGITWLVTKGAGNTNGLSGGGAVAGATIPLELGRDVYNTTAGGDLWVLKPQMVVPAVPDATYAGYVSFLASTL